MFDRDPNLGPASSLTWVGSLSRLVSSNSDLPVLLKVSGSVRRDSLPNARPKRYYY